jgi:hypothetical protein
MLNYVLGIFWRWEGGDDDENGGSVIVRRDGDLVVESYYSFYW